MRLPTVEQKRLDILSEGASGTKVGTGEWETGKGKYNE